MPGIVSSAYTLGDYIKTQSLADEGESRRTILSLLTRGASGFYKLNQPLIDVAVNTARTALQQSGIAANEVDVLLIGSNSLRSDHFSKDFGQDLLSQLALKDAYVQLVGFQNCGDSIPLLKTASSLINSGDARNVLIVIADDVDASKIPRVLKDSYVHSDGASAVVVSCQSRGLSLINSAIRHLELKPDENFDPNDLGAKLNSLLTIAKDLTAQLFVDGGSPQFVISHNMNQLYGHEIAKAFGINADSIFCDYELGHCLASDIFININKTLSDSASHLVGDGILLAPNSRSVGVYRVSLTPTLN